MGALLDQEHSGHPAGSREMEVSGGSAMAASLVFSDPPFLASQISRNGMLGHVVSVIALLEAMGHLREPWNTVTSVQLD